MEEITIVEALPLLGMNDVDVSTLRGEMGTNIPHRLVMCFDCKNMTCESTEHDRRMVITGIHEQS